MLTLVFVLALAAFAAGYRWYGRYLRRVFDLNDARPTPAVTAGDGRDLCPARAPVLFGHHFSSIAGAGPIVGPVLAGIAFGWLPALIWIVLGSIFIGGVHDLGSLAASIRHRARSIAEIARENITPRAGRLFLVLIWLALLLVLAAFIDLTAATFTADGGVATASGLYVLLAVPFGLCLYRLRMPLWLGTVIFVPLVFGAIWVGQQVPLGGAAGVEPASGLARSMIYLLGAYCFLASIAPVWLLLQPRDYLSSYLLYACLGAGACGILLSGGAVTYPALRSFSSANLGFLFPALFITVACGACSGFHSVVASGTTAKQLAREGDALCVGYGGMLVEGVLAVIALAAVMTCAAGSGALDLHPTQVFAAGLGRFASVLGVPEEAGTAFGLLAISTFLLTTLDTATRLARYVFEEFLGRHDTATRLAATAATLGVPLLILSMEVESAGAVMPAYKLIWPLFGSTNQLLGGIALLTVAVWLRRTGRNYLVAALPMAFMLVVTLWALVQIVAGALGGEGGLRDPAALVRFVSAGLLLVLALVLIVEAARVLAGGVAAKKADAAVPGAE